MDTLAFERDVRGPRGPGPRAQAGLALLIGILIAGGVAATASAEAPGGDSRANGADRELTPLGRPGRRY